MSRSSRRKLILNTYIEYALWSAFLAVFIRVLVISPYKIPSDSMSPSLLRGDFVFAYTLPFGIQIPFSFSKWGAARLPERGDILLYRYELDKKSLFIKRAMGLPGDKVEITKGKLIVNDAEVTTVPTDLELPAFLVPQNSVFLVGDNPIKSDDLQYWSIISKERVLGRIKWIWLSMDPGDNQIRWDRIFSTVH